MPKLTSKTALEFVTRIESLKNQIHEVYRDVGESCGVENINLIRSIVEARENVADARVEAEGLLESIDAEDEV